MYQKIVTNTSKMQFTNEQRVTQYLVNIKPTAPKLNIYIKNVQRQ